MEDTETVETTIFDALPEDDCTEDNKATIADVTSTNSRLNSELSFIDLWSAALTSVYGATETNTAGADNVKQEPSREIPTEPEATVADSYDPSVNTQNQADQLDPEEITATKPDSDRTENEEVTVAKPEKDDTENEPTALTETTCVDQQIQHNHTSSSVGPDREGKRKVDSADGSSGDGRSCEKNDTEVRLMQTLKELCSVVFSKNGKMKKAKSDVQQNESKQKGSDERPPELENNSGFAKADICKDSGRETSNGLNISDQHAKQNYIKSSSPKETVQTICEPVLQRDNGSIKMHIENQNKDYKLPDKESKNNVSTSSSIGTNDGLHDDNPNSDTHILIHMSSSSDNTDCDVDINEAYDIYMAHEAKRTHCELEKQDRQNIGATEMGESAQRNETDTITDKRLIHDIDGMKDTGKPSAQKTRNKRQVSKSTTLSNIPRPEKKQLNNMKNQIKDIKQNLTALPVVAVTNEENHPVGKDNLENMVAKKMTANLIVPLLFRHRFVLDSCSVKTFKQLSKDKSKLKVKLEIDYRIDAAAEQNSDLKQQYGAEVKKMDNDAIYTGVGARPKIPTNMRQHSSQQGMFKCTHGLSNKRKMKIKTEIL